MSELDWHSRRLVFYYERLQNQFAEEQKPRDKIITLPYLMQALIAVWLQQPDQARASPTRFAEKQYKNLFRDNFVPEMYANAALIMKTTEHFLRMRSPLVEAPDQLNVKFYVAMFATGLLTDHPWPKPRLAELNINDLTHPLLEASFVAVQEHYRKLISPERTADQVARGPDLVTHIKGALVDKLGARRPQGGV